MGRADERLIGGLRTARHGRKHRRSGARGITRLAALFLVCLLLPTVSAHAGLVTEDPAGSAVPDSAAADSVVCGPPADRVVLSYFHRTARCQNCLLFETYTDSLVHAAFGSELSHGALAWRVVNLDEDRNQDFVERYALEGITLLSVIVIDDEERGWRPLDGIWWLVDDREAFASYVAAEISADLETACAEHEAEAADSPRLDRELAPTSDGGGMDPPPSK